ERPELVGFAGGGQGPAGERSDVIVMRPIAGVVHERGIPRIVRRLPDLVQHEPHEGAALLDFCARTDERRGGRDQQRWTERNHLSSPVGPVSRSESGRIIGTGNPCPSVTSGRAPPSKRPNWPAPRRRG